MGKKGGFALVTAMMVLALLSVLSAMAIQSTTLEVQISAHDRDARSALYIAEAALDEARYYVSRGWGKITAPAVTSVPPGMDVEIATALPPGLASSWATNRYVGFSLVDTAGNSFPITANNNTFPYTFSLDTSSGIAPFAGTHRYLLVRTFNTPAWDGAAKTLTIADADWTLRAVDDLYNGWTLWDADNNAFPVEGTRVTGSDVILTLDTTSTSSTPNVLSCSLGINPWLAQLVNATALPGDANTSSANQWDRIFYDVNNMEIGRSAVTAQSLSGTTGADYALISGGQVAAGRQTVRIAVYQAGSRMQSFGDWSIDYE